MEILVPPPVRAGRRHRHAVMADRHRTHHNGAGRHRQIVLLRILEQRDVVGVAPGRRPAEELVHDVEQLQLDAPASVAPGTCTWSVCSNLSIGAGATAVMAHPVIVSSCAVNFCIRPAARCVDRRLVVAQLGPADDVIDQARPVHRVERDLGRRVYGPAGVDPGNVEQRQEQVRPQPPRLQQADIQRVDEVVVRVAIRDDLVLEETTSLLQILPNGVERWHGLTPE